MRDGENCSVTNETTEDRTSLPTDSRSPSSKRFPLFFPHFPDLALFRLFQLIGVEPNRDRTVIH